MMVTLVKHEWHQVDVQYAIEVDEALLSEIYPDMDEDAIETMLQQIADGEVDLECLVQDALDNDVELEWDHQYDDMWTMRKGGYDVTYELGDESSWVTPDTPPEPTHKCTNCKWTGQSYDGDWVWEDKDGNELEESKKVCPYCESDLELTEHGKVEEEEKKNRMAEIEAMLAEEEESIPCFSCDTPYKESELEYLGGQYICPNCGEGWVMLEDRPKE
jgi:Zn finger protein HypA/HybF involved in hydrogenase expression